MKDRPKGCTRNAISGRPDLMGYGRCRSEDVMFISSLNKVVYHECCNHCGMDMTLYYGRKAKQAKWVEIEYAEKEVEEIQIPARKAV